MYCIIVVVPVSTYLVYVLTLYRICFAIYSTLPVLTPVNTVVIVVIQYRIYYTAPVCNYTISVLTLYTIQYLF